MMGIRVIEKGMLLLTFFCFAAEVMGRESRTLLLEKELFAEEKLKLINKPAVKSIQVFNFLSLFVWKG